MLKPHYRPALVSTQSCGAEQETKWPGSVHDTHQLQSAPAIPGVRVQMDNPSPAWHRCIRLKYLNSYLGTASVGSSWEVWVCLQEGRKNANPTIPSTSPRPRGHSLGGADSAKGVDSQYTSNKTESLIVTHKNPSSFNIINSLHTFCWRWDILLIRRRILCVFMHRT